MHAASPSKCGTEGPSCFIRAKWMLYQLVIMSYSLTHVTLFVSMCTLKLYYMYYMYWFHFCALFRKDPTVRSPVSK